MNTYTAEQTLMILQHAVKTGDIQLADRALRAHRAVIKAQTHLERMAAAYAPLTWDSVESK